MAQGNGDGNGSCRSILQMAQGTGDWQWILQLAHVSHRWPKVLVVGNGSQDLWICLTDCAEGSSARRDSPNATANLCHLRWNPGFPPKLRTGIPTSSCWARVRSSERAVCKSEAPSPYPQSYHRISLGKLSSNATPGELELIYALHYRRVGNSSDGNQGSGIIC